MNKETNSQNQFIVSYNENDFYCNSIAKTVSKDILNNKDIPSYCIIKSLKFYDNGYEKKCPSKPSTPTSTSTDFVKKCAVLNEICKNQENYDYLKEIQTTHSVSTSRFQDMDSFYNTEVLKSVNLGIGIAFLLFIIFREI